MALYSLIDPFTRIKSIALSLGETFVVDDFDCSTYQEWLIPPDPPTPGFGHIKLTRVWSPHIDGWDSGLAQMNWSPESGGDKRTWLVAPKTTFDAWAVDDLVSWLDENADTWEMRIANNTTSESGNWDVDCGSGSTPYDGYQSIELVHSDSNESFPGIGGSSSDSATEPKGTYTLLG